MNVMPPMATLSAKRKWSESFGDADICDKQSIMDLCTSKLRYVNPARPPRRRTEVPLLRNVLIVNTMKHLSAEMKTEKQMEYSEDLTVDPGHFEGLPPLSELLTDIMLDPQPIDQQQPSASFGWASTGAQQYANLTPLEPSIPSYMDTEDNVMEGVEEEKIVHDLLPCTSVIGLNSSQQHASHWESQSLSRHIGSSWQDQNTSLHNSMSWNSSCDTSVLDCFLSSASLQQSASDSLDSLASDLAFQTSSTPLPSFTSLFESHHSFTDMSLSSTGSQPVSNAQSHLSTTNQSTFSTLTSASGDDIVGSLHLSESELEILLAMTVSSKHMSLEDLVQALPLQQASQPSQSFYVPSSLQSSSATGCDNTPTANAQCSSYCRNDQPPPNVDDNSLVRVLVNL
ncbi:hypothetical protein Btru_052042 [Bulinus truncatus]|nr:hypothetical protein Btru_052042 [Bulinus truncatus]